MEIRKWAVILDGIGGYPTQLCECDSPESVAELVRMLAGVREPRFRSIRLEMILSSAPDKAPDSDRPFG